jgi:hypothetical protein
VSSGQLTGAGSTRDYTVSVDVGTGSNRKALAYVANNKAAGGFAHTCSYDSPGVSIVNVDQNFASLSGSGLARTWNITGWSESGYALLSTIGTTTESSVQTITGGGVTWSEIGTGSTYGGGQHIQVHISDGTPTDGDLTVTLGSDVDFLGVADQFFLGEGTFTTPVSFTAFTASLISPDVGVIGEGDLVYFVGGNTAGGQTFVATPNSSVLLGNTTDGGNTFIRALQTAYNAQSNQDGTSTPGFDGMGGFSCGIYAFVLKAATGSIKNMSKVIDGGTISQGDSYYYNTCFYYDIPNEDAGTKGFRFQLDNSSRGAGQVIIYKDCQPGAPYTASNESLGVPAQTSSLSLASASVTLDRNSTVVSFAEHESDSSNLWISPVGDETVRVRNNVQGGPPNFGTFGTDVTVGDIAVTADIVMSPLNYTTEYTSSQLGSLVSCTAVALSSRPLRQLVTNGGFDTDTDWTVGTDWTIAGGVAAFNGTPVRDIWQPSAPLIEGVRYRVRFDLTIISGTGAGVYARLDGTLGALMSTTGVYDDIIVAGAGTDGVLIRAEGTGTVVLEVDNVIVEALGRNSFTIRP